MPAAVEGRRRLQADERKKLLLNDAIEVFARRGIGRGGHTEIAQQAGVSVATVFNYFNTREALVGAVLDEVESFLLNLAERVYEDAENPVDGIKNHIQAFLKACEENSNYIKVWLEWSASVREDTWPRYIEFQTRLLEIITAQVELAIKEGLLIDGLAPIERARWAIGNAHMLVSMVFSPMGKPDGMEEMVERGFNHIIGIRES